MPQETVLAHLREQSDKHFDPRVVGAFLEMMEADQTKIEAAERPLQGAAV
jgi:HD-GYP domain-containing protein (c-di-GMP phosphodiesterase class II)